jgi:hypothetical protein
LAMVERSMITRAMIANGTDRRSRRPIEGQKVNCKITDIVEKSLLNYIKNMEATNG